MARWAGSRSSQTQRHHVQCRSHAIERLSHNGVTGTDIFGCYLARAGVNVNPDACASVAARVAVKRKELRIISAVSVSNAVLRLLAFLHVGLSEVSNSLSARLHTYANCGITSRQSDALTSSARGKWGPASTRLTDGHSASRLASWG